MKVANKTTLCNDDGTPIVEGTTIYDPEHGFIGTFAGFRDEIDHDEIMIAITIPGMEYRDTDNENLFSFACAAEWRTKPIEPGDHVVGLADELVKPNGKAARDVIEAGSTEIQYRFAKECIGIAPVELNRAYAEFDIDGNGNIITIPTGRIQKAQERLGDVMSYLDIDGDSMLF